MACMAFANPHLEYVLYLMGLISGFIGHGDQYVSALSFVEMIEPKQFDLKMLRESCSSALLFSQESHPVRLKHLELFVTIK